MCRSAFIRGVAVAVAALLPSVGSAQPLTLNQVDNFEGGGLQNWSQGVSSPPGALTVVPGGPSGSTQNMQITSSGMFGSGSRLVAFNQAQWVGNYTAAGINAIEMDFRSPTNSATATLHMRIAFRSPFGSGYLSNAIDIPNDGIWHHVSYPLTAANFTAVGGPADPFATFIATTSDQQELRILSAAGNFSLNGDTIAAIVGVDNIKATGVPVPEPASVLAVAVAAALVGRRVRRRRIAVP